MHPLFIGCSITNFGTTFTLYQTSLTCLTCFCVATGWLSSSEAPLCPGPCNAGRGAWRQRATTGLLPKGVRSTCWMPAKCPSATPPARPWWTRPPSRSSPSSRCCSPWDSTSTSWEGIAREMQILLPEWSAMEVKEFNRMAGLEGSTPRPGEILIELNCNRTRKEIQFPRCNWWLDRRDTVLCLTGSACYRRGTDRKKGRWFGVGGGGGLLHLSFIRLLDTAFLQLHAFVPINAHKNK